MTKHIANILTSCRILGSILLLLLSVFSLPFYILYHSNHCRDPRKLLYYDKS